MKGMIIFAVLAAVSLQRSLATVADSDPDYKLSFLWDKPEGKDGKPEMHVKLDASYKADSWNGVGFSSGSGMAAGFVAFIKCAGNPTLFKLTFDKKGPPISNEPYEYGVGKSVDGREILSFQTKGLLEKISAVTPITEDNMWFFKPKSGGPCSEDEMADMVFGGKHYERPETQEIKIKAAEDIGCPLNEVDESGWIDTGKGYCFRSFRNEMSYKEASEACEARSLSNCPARLLQAKNVEKVAMIAGKEGLPAKSMIDAYRNTWSYGYPMWMDSKDMKVMFPGPPLTPNYTYPYMPSKTFFAVYNSEEYQIQGDHCPSAYICESCSMETFQCPAVCDACLCEDMQCPAKDMDMDDDEMMMGWVMWSEWSQCSKDCNGMSTRTRYCMGGENADCAGMMGAGYNYENMACDGGECPEE